MTSLLAACFTTPFLYLILALTWPQSRLRRALGPLGLILFLTWLFWGSHCLDPLQRLLCCSLWLLYVIKGWALLNVPDLRTYSPLGLLLYSYLWPGVDPRPFRERQTPDETAARWFVMGFPTAALGVAAGMVLAVNSGELSPVTVGLAGIAVVLVIVHLGYSDILSCGMRLAGFPVGQLFDRPLLSHSVRDFWSCRWNRPFVEMNKLLFRPLLKPMLGGSTALALFAISGALHELALSYPPGAGFGGPLAYFLIQGTAMKLERHWDLDRRRWLGRVWTWVVILLPVPLLFHAPFREALVLPLWAFLHSLPALSDGESFMRFALTAAAYGHFLVLVASSQVPHRLGWKEDLKPLRPLNRKLLWTYGGYIAAMILLWGVLTLQLLPEMMAGERAALALAGVIALFWWSRVVVDALVFEHSDWPEGVEFVLGHTLLTSLFVTIASCYTALLWWHL